MKKIRRPLSIIIMALLGAFFAFFGVYDYIAFLKTWGVSGMDLLFMAMVLAMLLMGSIDKKSLANMSKTRSWIVVGGGLVLLVAWVLGDWVLFPEGSRFSELIDVLWSWILAGLWINWAVKAWLRDRKSQREQSLARPDAVA